MKRMDGLVALAVAATTAAALAAQAPAADTKAPKAKLLTLIGCVADDETAEGQLTLADMKDGTMYRLSGTDARDYVGKRVQVVGAPNPNKVKFRGGLAPSPNIAAQAGAIDPTRMAMAEQGSERGTAADLPEFKVKTVKPTVGDCPPKK